MRGELNQVCASEFDKWQSDVDTIIVVIADIAHRCSLDEDSQRLMYHDFCVAIDNALDRLHVTYRDSVNNIRAKHWQKITGGGK